MLVSSLSVLATITAILGGMCIGLTIRKDRIITLIVGCFFLVISLGAKVYAYTLSESESGWKRIPNGFYQILYATQTKSGKEHWLVVKEEKEEKPYVVKIKNDIFPRTTTWFVKGNSKFYPIISPVKTEQRSPSQ